MTPIWEAPTHMTTLPWQFRPRPKSEEGMGIAFVVLTRSRLVVGLLRLFVAFPDVLYTVTRVSPSMYLLLTPPPGL